jgi:hypothetical protein
MYTKEMALKEVAMLEQCDKREVLTRVVAM